MNIYTPLKINSFTPVNIPSAKELFGRFGLTTKPSGGYTEGESAPPPSSKVEAAASVLKDIPKDE